MRAGPLLSRAFLVCVLLAVLFGACVAYGSVGPAPERNVYPDHRDIADDYDRYVGDRVVVSGEVVSTDPLVVSASDGQGAETEYRIVESDRSPAVGQSLWTFGVARPDSVIAANRGVVVPAYGSLYAYGASALAGGWVLGRVVRRWRLDPEAGLVRRDEPLWVPLGVGQRGDHDPSGADTTGDREGEDA
ncbi:hypothetical protein [Salinirubrum litoreum]|uniref:Outer membrane lipoprotein n=1 Tax=Salinirubrum litoreum TaxID=1126234 RepID=A0ABD5R5U5_9EURY|nr:hypothetical protein [Salinirubrum litoreum]